MQKRFGISIGIFLLIILAISVYAARLPTVNSDNNAWGDVLNDFLGVAHDSAGNIKGDHITSTMILNGTVGNGDIARNTINTSHVIDNTLLGADISTTANVNVTSLILGPGNVTGTANLAVVNHTNITGIFMNSSVLDLPALSPATPCRTVPINMTGLPANAWCIPFVASNSVNLSVMGTNSTINNCLLVVCCVTINGTTFDPPSQVYGAIAITPGSGLLFGWGTA